MKRILKGQIYYSTLDPVVGSEQGGYRPVLILQNDKGNYFSPTVIVAPITSNKMKLPTHVYINKRDKLKNNSVILLEQLRVIDKSRLKSYVGKISKEQTKEVNDKIKVVFDLKKKEGAI